MNEDREKQLVHDTINTFLSDVQGDPWLARRILNDVKEEHKMKKKLPWSIVLALVLVLTTVVVAIAATQWGAFDHLIAGPVKNADSVMQSDLYQEIVNDVQITVKEAGYDGKTLWLTTSYVFPDITAPLGHAENGIPVEWFELLPTHHVGWWMDGMWIGGKEVDMPSDSYSTMDGSDVPGELLVYETWRLDHENIFLNGTTEIALPIGDTQSTNDYTLAKHPDKFDADGHMKVPEQGMITFTFTPNTVDVRTEHPCIKAELPLVTAQASEVVYSPIMTYITLDVQANPDAMAAFVEEHGASIVMTDEGNGQSFTYEYTGNDVFGDWLRSLVLVDRAGNEIFPNMEDRYGTAYGFTGSSDTTAEFLFPYCDTWPDEVYLAPEDDVSLSIRIK